MNGLGFSALALASTNAASNALAMPLPMLLGSLSDRTGRKRYLVAGYVLGVAALAILSGSSLLWQFMIASVLVVVPLRTSGLGLALVTDLVPRPSLSRALAWAGSARWIGGILGYAGAGAAFQRLGTGATLAIGMALSAIPIVLLVFARKRRRRPYPRRVRWPSRRACGPGGVLGATGPWAACPTGIKLRAEPVPAF